MSRLRRIEQSHRYFFVTTNLANGIPHLSAFERSLVLHDLGIIRSKMDFLLLAYVVMPNHIHLLIYPRGTTLTSVLRTFKARTAHSLNEARHSIGPIWQSRFFDFICRRVHDFWAKVEYIHQNPVAAGLASSADEWPWSSAAVWDAAKPGLLRSDRIEMPLAGDTLLWPAFSR